MYIYIYMCVYVCMYIYAGIYIYMCVCVYVYESTRLYKSNSGSIPVACVSSGAKVHPLAARPKAKSSGEDPRATRGLFSNLPHPRVNKTKQHQRKKEIDLDHPRNLRLVQINFFLWGRVARFRPGPGENDESESQFRSQRNHEKIVSVIFWSAHPHMRVGGVCEGGAEVEWGMWGDLSLWVLMGQGGSGGEKKNEGAESRGDRGEHTWAEKVHCESLLHWRCASSRAKPVRCLRVGRAEAGWWRWVGTSCIARMQDYVCSKCWSVWRDLTDHRRYGTLDLLASSLTHGICNMRFFQNPGHIFNTHGQPG